MSERIPFIDLHAHFPMHGPFPPMPFADHRDAWKKGLFEVANRLFNEEHGHPRVSLERWFADAADGRVSGFGSVLYDPEDEFLVRTGSTPIPAAIDHIRAQLNNVERELRADGRVTVARNPTQVRQHLDSDTPFIFHTLEGGFSLGGNADHVGELARMGVASLIPAHLLYRGVATCENGFPPIAHPIFKDELSHQPPFGLSRLGREIIEACFTHGIIVDITHAREDAQADIFEMVRAFPGTPLISSHNAVRGVAPHGLNLSDTAIDRIAESNGVIGIIFYVQWLRRGILDRRGDITLITDVIDYVRARTGSFHHIAIGSDLDGFIDPIDLCSNYSKMSALVVPLVEKYGRTAAEHILYRNALRVLESGWRGVDAFDNVQEQQAGEQTGGRGNDGTVR